MEQTTRSIEASPGSTDLATRRSHPAVETIAAVVACIAILFAVSFVNLNDKAQPELGAADPALMPESGGIIGATHTTLVSEFASFNTPGVVDGRVEGIAIDGDTVFVGGTFTQIHDPLSDEIIDQPYLFAYSKSSGDILRDFDPQLNNPVQALERTGDGTGVFAGGVFTNLNGEIRAGLVKIDNNGDRVSGFGARLDGAVSSMVRLNDTLYIGGNFNSISGAPVEHLAAVDTTTGAVDPNLNFDFDGVLLTPTTIDTSTQSVDEVDITPDGKLLVIVGNFSIIDGISRHRVAVIELEGQATVSAWNTDVYDVQCPINRFPQYIFGMDISPDGSYFLTGTSGFLIRDNPNDPNDTRDNPACDTTNRFELNDLTNTDVQPTWTNYTGGDSVYEVVSTGHAVYIGGHFEFLDNDSNNGGSGNRAGRGSSQRAGLAALDPLNGLTLRNWQSDRSPRGLGVFAMLSEDEGIYIGDDTDFLNGTEHKKLKFLPVTNDAIVRPDVPTLPTTILSIDDDALVGSSFDGTFPPGAPVQLLDTGWQTARGGMFVGGKLFHVDDNGALLSSVMSDTAFESPTTVDLFGMIEIDWALSRLTSMYFNYQLGRVYYTLENDTRLFYRYFTPGTEFFGSDEYVALEQGDILWDDVTGMDVIDDHLYFTRSDGVLYRSDIDGASVISGTTIVADSSRDWNNNLFAFMGDGTFVGQSPVAQFEFDSSGSQNTGRVRNFEFEVVAGEPVDVRLEWFDPTARLNLFVRDANDVLVASDNSSAGSPKYVTAPAGVGGTYKAVVIVAEGSTAYNLQINPIAGPPPALADFEFSSSGSNTSGRFQRFDFDVVAGERIDAQVIWDSVATPGADVRIFLRDENNSLIINDTDGSGSPATVSALATTSGLWTLAVLAASDVTVNYDVLIDTTVPPPTTIAINVQPVDVTIIEGEDAAFTVNATGSGTLSYQWFAGNEAIAGETSDTLNLASVTLADSGTIYSVVVSDNNTPVASDNATLTVNAIPLADFEFSSSGSNTSGRFQRFDFDVVAGERIDAQVIWDNVATPGADVRIFLRDENNSLIIRDVDGSGSPAMVSTIAATSGEWTLAVRADSDVTVEYDVLIDTTVPPPTTIAINVQPVDVTIFEGEDAAFTVNATGSGTLSYQWFAGSDTLAGETSDTLNVASVTLADSGTIYSVVVSDNNTPVTSDNATLTVNAIPLADFEFSSSGSNTSGRFQRFDFDVVAGERIDAQVIWDSVATPGADVRIFLRDENNSLIIRDVDGSGSPAMVSTIAATSGEWTLAVRADSDVTVEYDVLIDTTE